MAPQNPTLTLDTSSPIGTFFRFLSRYKWTDLDRSKWPSTGESNRWRSRPMLLVGISSESGKLGWYEVVMMTSRPNVREKGPGNYVAICPFPTLVRLVHDRLRLTNGGRLGMSSNGESFAVLDSRTPYPTHLFTPMYPNDDSLNAQYRLSNASLLVIQRLIRDREGAVRRVLPSPLPPPQESLQWIKANRVSLLVPNQVWNEPSLSPITDPPVGKHKWTADDFINRPPTASRKRPKATYKFGHTAKPPPPPQPQSSPPQPLPAPAPPIVTEPSEPEQPTKWGFHNVTSGKSESWGKQSLRRINLHRINQSTKKWEGNGVC